MILPEMIYSGDMILRKVKHQGDISWKGHHIYLSETLAGEQIGLKQTTDRLWDIYFGPIKLAQLDTGQLRLIHMSRTLKPKTNEENNNINSKKVLPMCPV